MDSCFPDLISGVCHQKYNSLPQRGKPIRTQSEWTLLSAILYTKFAGEPVVVAMGTGSKCIGKSKMSLTGNILNDSHAEVMARRAFISYLLDELLKITRGEESEVLDRCVESEEFICKVKDGVQFHMYSSHTPCGDASIFPKQNESDQGEVVDSDSPSHSLLQKRKVHSSDLCCKRLKKDTLSKTNDDEQSFCNTKTDQTNLSTKQVLELKCSEVQKSTILNSADEKLTSDWLSCVDTSRQKVRDLDVYNLSKNHSINVITSENGMKNQTEVERSDIYRTGAKCVPGGLQDPKGPGSNYHCIGVLRIKPGRGDRTISMSCSDKIARWNVLGCQGALLSHFFKLPIYLKTLTTGRCPYDPTAMERALVDRISMVTDLPIGYNVNKIECYQSKQSFCDGKEALEESMNLPVTKGTKVHQISKPSSNALFWWLGDQMAVGVTVNGRKQGVTVKNIDKPGARCSICTLEIFKQFHGLLSAIGEDQRPHSLRSLDANNSYLEFKSSATSFQTALNRLSQVFSLWISKPRDHLKFTTSG